MIANVAQSPLKQNKVISLASLVPHPRNYRIHPQHQIDKLILSLQRFGQGRSIVVQDGPEKLIIVAGHGVYEAAQALEWQELRADILPADWSDAQIEGYLIADNLHSQEASDNEELLAMLLQEQQDAGFDLASLGTDDETLRQMLEAMGDDLGSGYSEGAGGDDFDTTPEEGPTRTHYGELWQLGDHRLLVGDCTKREDVERVMQGEKADMVFTDPPYGVNYTGGTKEWDALENDHDATIYSKSMPILPSVMQEKAALYTCFADRAAKQVYDAVEGAGFEVRSLLIWNKNHAQFGAMGAHYKQKHEPILYCARRGGSLNWYGPNNEVTVWDIDRASANEFHPTQKPIELVVRALTNSSMKEDIVLDIFGGGGSTLIACQRTGREARLIEIEPKWADVILRRYEAETGQTATLLDRVEVPAHV